MVRDGENEDKPVRRRTDERKRVKSVLKMTHDFRSRETHEVKRKHDRQEKSTKSKRKHKRKFE